MYRKLTLGLVVLGCPAVLLIAQQTPSAPAAQPLTAMPYSPSLDPANMDKTVDPCMDFYKYSCGGWMKSNPIPADQPGWSVYAKLTNDNQQFLWGILEQDAKPAATRTAVQQKVGDYFEACMNTTAIDAAGDKPVQPALAQINAAKTREQLIDVMEQLQHRYPGAFVFDSGTTQDSVDSSLIIVELGANGLGLPDRDYYIKTDDKSIKIRQQYSDYIVQLMQLAGETPDEAKADAAAVLRIETELAKGSLTRVERRDPYATYHMMTLDELTKLTPSIDWAAYLKLQGGEAIHGDLKKLNVSQPKYMEAVQAALAKEDVAALRGYLRFHLVAASAPYLAKPFAQADFDFFSTTLRGVPAMPPRWKTCVRSVNRNLGEALGQEFVARTFSADTKAKTQLMTEQIETAMQHEIETLDWMSPETKKEAVRKLHAIRNKIGYPATWRNYGPLTVERDDYFGNTLRAETFEDEREWNKLGKPVDLNEWGMTPPTVNAYFNPQMNDINFPAGVLQPPLYDPKEDDAPNYGDTGTTIGHELTHAFDDEGRQFDWKGNLKDWWTADDAKKFDDRINCIRDQYSSYVIVDDVHIQGKLTSGEDVADLGGTLLAYIAWKRQTEGINLPDKDGLTPDQRYFVGMAQWACANERPENLRVDALMNPHSPGWARVNGVVVNMPEFQKAFSCKVGQPMVHTPSCKVW
jgi:putative endopeptidase